MNKYSLSELANITMGQSPPGEYCGSELQGIPLLNGPAEFTNFSPIPVQYTTDPKKICNAGDILFCVRGSTTGRMNWADREYAIGRGLAAINHKKGKSYNYFLKYLIQNHLNSLLNNTNGSTFPNLTADLIASFKVNVPGEEVQLKISKFLSSLDDKIELNNRINSELENLAKTIYDYWFVQFDFPDENGKPYKSSGGKMVYNQEIKREIPVGWEVKKLRQFASTASGGTPLSTKKEYYENGSIAWINSGELNNRYITEAKNFITQSGLNNSSAKLFESNTLLVAMYGATAGKVSLLHINACTNQAICAIIPNSDIYTKFLKFATDDLYNFLINLSTGSARDNLSQDLIRKLSFALPQEDLLVKFNQMVNPMIMKILINQKENQQLTQLRDWLLPMLMNGQITIK
jgi:type I restriction enzyme S subunit